jgi:sulfide:quinone oxidoreductase
VARLQRVVVIGGGTGGTLAANILASKLRREIDSGLVSVTLLSETRDHIFQPANLDIAFKGADPRKYIRDERSLLSRRVEFLNEGVERVDLGRREVLTASGRSIDYRFLVIATGSKADPELIPGLAEDAYNFHTGPWDAAKIWDALQRFDRGRIVLVIAGVPHKCPPAPTEAMFLLDDYFRKRGIRDRVELTFLTPYPHAYPAKPIADVVEPLLERRGINVNTFFNIESVDPVKKRVHSLEGDEVEYDMLIAIPPHRGSSLAVRSEIGDQEGWIPADKHTMKIPDYDDSYVIGDATNIPISKSGVVAHIQAAIVAHNISSEILGFDGKKRFNGRINCPLEVGAGKALFVAGTYERPPKPMKPTRIKYLMKKSFATIYWHMLTGRLEPLFDLYFR